MRSNANRTGLQSKDPFEETTWETVATIFLISLQLMIAGIVFYLALKHSGAGTFFG